MIWVRKLGRSGNSLYVAIPPAIARALNLRARDQVAVVLIDSKVQISKVDERQLLGEPPAEPEPAT